ncbi:MAG TPA: BTAD domain-containing putative transcriptional regulator [Mycobacteriales bacterium]|nr:BTAD domain-containing putative transcriptional regulator [Mycobacteriales bacterium]
MVEEAEPPRFDLLGPLRAHRAGQELDLGPGKQRAVLAVLLLARGTPVSIDRIVAAVWPDEPPENGVNTVQKYIAGLRRVLEPERSPRAPARLLVRTDAGYRIPLEPGGLDVDRHADLLRQARAARDGGDLPGAEALLGAALALVAGEPLAGLPGAGFDAARRRLVEDIAVARELLAEVGLAAGRHRELVPELVRLVADFPLREEPRALLMLALYRSGRQAEALDGYREAHQFLAEELGVEPGDRLRDLHQRILRADPTLAGPPPPAAPSPVPSPAPSPIPPQPGQAGWPGAAGWSGPGGWAGPVGWPDPGDWTGPGHWEGPGGRAAPARPVRVGWWRLVGRGALAAVVPFGTAGLATFIAIGWFATWRRSQWLLLASVGYLALVATFFLLFDPDAPDGPDAALAIIALFTSWLGGTIHAVILAVRPRRRGAEPPRWSAPDGSGRFAAPSHRP